MTDTEQRKYSRSISQLNALSTCGERFYLERLRKHDIDRRPAAWTIGGSSFHESVMQWEKSDRQECLLTLFEESFDRILHEEQQKQPNLQLWMKAPRSKSTENDIKNYRKRFLEKDIPLYLKRAEEAEWEIAELPDGSKALELEFELDFDGVTVKGSLDRIQWWPSMKANAIEDLKTGSADGDVNTRQLGLYKIAAEEVYDINLKWGRFWYTKLDRPSDSWTDLSRYTREYFTEQFHRMDTVVQQGLFLPNPGKQCGLCSVMPWCSELGWLEVGERL